MNINNKIYENGFDLHQRLNNLKTNSINLKNIAESKVNIQEIIDLWSNEIEGVSSLEKRLSWDDISLDSLNKIQYQNISSNSQIPWKFWLKKIRELGNKEIVEDSRDLFQDIPFCDLWRPVSNFAIQRIRRKLSYLKNINIKESALKDLEYSLLQSLSDTSVRVVWLLFNEFRDLDKAIKNYKNHKARKCELSEEDTEEYKKFIIYLLKNGYEILFSRYPVLAKFISIQVRLWSISVLKLIKRIDINWNKIANVFKIYNLNSISKFEPNKGDNHRGNQTVTIIHFQSSKNRTYKLIYKPKDIRLEETFQVLIKELNYFSDYKNLKTLKTLKFRDFGFIEYINYIPCKCTEEYKTFYFNAGRLLSILYFLGANDCHYENLIAVKENLYLIDVETLFEPQVPFHLSEGQNSRSYLMEKLEDSVLTTGFLANTSFIKNSEGKLFDISAIGAKSDLSSSNIVHWDYINTDIMFISKENGERVTSHSQPFDNPYEIDISSYISELSEGFSVQYKIIIENKERFIEILELFRSKKRRIVIRPTYLYEAIKQKMLEPNSLTNYINQGIVLENLTRSFLVSKKRPKFWSLHEEEIKHLNLLDIPYFEHILDSSNVSMTYSKFPLKNFISKNGLDSAKSRIMAAGNKDLNFQKRLIETSFFLGENSSKHYFAQDKSEENNSFLPLIKEDKILLINNKNESIIKLAQDIWDSSVLDNNGNPEWIGIEESINSKHSELITLGPSLYNGYLGLALVFARIAIFYKNSNQKDKYIYWNKKVIKTVNPFINLISDLTINELNKEFKDTSLGLSGIGGFLIALNILEEFGFKTNKKNFNFFECTQKLLKSLNNEQITQDKNLDFLNGTAGLLSSLISLSESRFITTCITNLLEKQESNGSWISGSNSKNGLTGLSHGVAGISMTLSKCLDLNLPETLKTKIYKSISKAIFFENQNFCKINMNWLDLREDFRENKFMTSWCHGAPGIALSRAILYESLNASDNMKNDLINACKASFNYLEKNYDYLPDHVCCGKLGISLVLKIINNRIDKKIFNFDSQIQLSREKQFFENKNHFCLMHRKINPIFQPGLFNGLSGVILSQIEINDGLLFSPLILSGGLLK